MPDRLLQRVKAKLGPQAEARLLEYKIGERFSVSGVSFSDSSLMTYPAKPPAEDHRAYIAVRLRDQFAEKDEDTTDVVVVWPEPFSDSFTERPRVEKLLMTLFSRLPSA